ncbi:MAG TPA: WYL domain-containing protein [Acidimicrobiia bacterium]
MAERAEAPYVRMLRLAAFVRDVNGECSLEQIGENVPGYSDLDRAVLEKKVQRDLADLAAYLGVRITWHPEDQMYRLEQPYFTPKERAALIAAAALVDVDGIADQLPPGELGAAVAQDTARVVIQVHRQVVDLRDAIATRTRVRFRYHGRERTVAPYGVGMWRNRWYLAGSESASEPIRKYRLDRIEVSDDGTAITLLTDTPSYEIPAGFDLAAELQLDPNTWGSDPEVTARVLVTNDQVPVFLSEFDGTTLDTAVDSTVIDVVVRDYQSFIIRLLGFGTGVRLIAPPLLVERMRAWLEPQAASA